jgi:hypothetical protein
MSINDELARWREWPGPREEPEDEPSEPWARGAPDRRHARHERRDDDS